MNTNHDISSSKTHAHVGLPTTQVPAAQRVPSAGSLRQRGSSKRNPSQNPHPKGKKHHPDRHKEEEPSQNVSAIEQRLAKAVHTKKLDLSLPVHIRAPPEPPVRGQPLHIQPFQIFPTIVIKHVDQGHHLTELWLTNHHLGSLPAEIAVFTKLRVLGLAGNAITTLPEELGNLKDLEALYLDKNYLRTLPAKIVFPTKLRELRLDNNELSYFPVQITKLRLLNRLGLSHNQLKTLPEEIHRLRNLVELDLDYNQLEADLPDGFLALQRLTRIGLEGNFLAERPAVLDRLPSLSYIRLNGNRAKRFLLPKDGVVGSTRQLLVVPKRHDGYFQCVEIDNNKETERSEQSSTNHRSLEGLVPCRDQNILNMLAYYTL